MRSLLLILPLLSLSAGFVIPSQQRQSTRWVSLLEAKKNKKKQRSGTGFGKKVTTTETSPTKSNTEQSSPFNNDVASSSSSSSSSFSSAGTSSSSDNNVFLQSVETGGSTAIPEIAIADKDELPPEERTKKLLREKYGMRTLQEERMEQNIQEQRRKLDEWKQLAEKGEDVDIMAMIPPPVISAIDTFLKFGVGVSMTLFVLAGLGITVEAWSTTSGTALPENIDSFIESVIEPNFTYGLGIVLFFSIGLGVFSVAQLGSASSQYREDS